MTRPVRQSAPARAPFAPLVFFAQGLPTPQGNHSLSRTGVIYEATKGHRIWRREVAIAAMLARRSTPITRPGSVALDFYLLRPHTSRRPMPSVRPDLSKLIRSTEDALVEGMLLADDALIVSLSAAKVYARPGSPCGCAITIHDAEDPCQTPTP